MRCFVDRKIEIAKLPRFAWRQGPDLLRRTSKPYFVIIFLFGRYTPLDRLVGNDGYCALERTRRLVFHQVGKDRR